MNNLIRCDNLTKLLGSFCLSEIDFAVPKGCILGVIGRNGSGKTTLLRSILGYYRLIGDAQGDICIDGVSARDNIKGYKDNVAYVLNDIPFENSIKVIELGLIRGRYYKGFNISRYMELIDRYGISEKKRVDELSKGEQIKLQLAFALSRNSKVFVMDEPTGKLDVKFRDEFYGIVRELVSDGGKTVIYSSHLIEELEGLADYILWIKRREDNSTVKYFGALDGLRDGYQIIEGYPDSMNPVRILDSNLIVGGRYRDNHKEILVRLPRNQIGRELEKYARYAQLKEIFYYEEKGMV